MAAEIVIGIAVIIANVFVWVFLFGRRQGKVNQRLNNVEGRLASHKKLLGEGSDTFTIIKEKLAKIEGNVQVILGLVQKD